MKKNTIDLDNIDGFEFEHVCRDIFDNLDYGEVEVIQATGDMGRDLIIYTDQGKIVVECKHHPRSSIGRPIIQKLHSAVISEGGIKGIVVTTGTFSKQAREHARTLTPPIELIDRSILNDLATRAGIELLTSSESGTVYSYPVSDNKLLKFNISKYLERMLISKPYRIEDMIKIKNKNVQLKSAYMINYSIKAKFETTVGEIHNEYGSGTVFIDGNYGRVNNGLSNIFNNIALNEFSQENSKGVRLNPFKIPLGSVKETAMDHIIKKHTKTVSYVGGNNQRYRKVCEPKKKDVFISDISQVYFPEININFNLNKKKRNLLIADNGTPNFLVYKQNIQICEICNNQLHKKGILCNSCGNVSHDKKFFNSHSFYCRSCGKSLCRSCTSYFTKFLFFKKPVCNECAKKEIRIGRKVSRFPSI